MDFNFNQNLILENNRVRLEPLEARHFEYLLPIALAYPDLLRYSPSKFGTAEALQNYMTTAFQNKEAKQRYPFAIFDKNIQQYVGTTSYGNIKNAHQRIEVGWTWITKSVQRTGLNRNSKFLLLQYVFETLEFERFELKTDSRNWQSRNAMMGIGAKYEGELRSHTLMSDGFRRNTVYYSILKDEWKGIKETIFKKVVEENTFL